MKSIRPNIRMITFKSKVLVFFRRVFVWIQKLDAQIALTYGIYISTVLYLFIYSTNFM